MTRVESVSVRAFSNGPGLCCASCQKAGYPSTNGVTYSGDSPVAGFIITALEQPLNLLFKDPNLKITGMKTMGTRKMKEIMSRYARLTECDVRTLCFSFDGERIAEDDTPKEVRITSLFSLM